MEERNALLEMFKFESKDVRTAIIDDEPWFAALDVAAALGYKNPSKAIADHCKAKGVTKRYTLTGGGGLEPMNPLLRWWRRTFRPAIESSSSTNLRAMRSERYTATKAIKFKKLEKGA
jgi:hypothetical protein